jgi:DnaJ-class molecular chaperone
MVEPQDLHPDDPNNMTDEEYESASDSCQRCEGDGYLDIMDPDHYGAVIGARECPDCGGTGAVAYDPWNKHEEEYNNRFN